jgi:hypothetical protein
MALPERRLVCQEGHVVDEQRGSASEARRPTDPTHVMAVERSRYRPIDARDGKWKVELMPSAK